MMPFVALVSAALYGAADFLGGLASRRMKTAAVVATSQASGLLVLLAVTLLLPPADPTLVDVGWGMAAGLSGCLGVALLYRALAPTCADVFRAGHPASLRCSSLMRGPGQRSSVSSPSSDAAMWKSA